MPYLERDSPNEGLNVLLKYLIQLTHAQNSRIRDCLTNSLRVIEWSPFGEKKQ